MSSDKKLQYGYKCGFGCRWMPSFVQRIIVRTYNFFACRLFGHSWFPDDIRNIDTNPTWKRERCTDCLKIRKVNKT